MSQRPDADRRPIAQRDWPVFQRMASAMARRGVSANGISVAGMGFALVSAAAFAATNHTCCGLHLRALWLLAALGILLRLLANMFDGMVAIAQGTDSPSGAVFNEAPDRFSDAVILGGAGLAHGGDVYLGLLAGLLALGVAYVRALGASLGAGQAFIGPFAKQQRMALLIASATWCALTPAGWQPIFCSQGAGIIAAVLALICLGCVVTIIRRLRWIVARLPGTEA